MATSPKSKASDHLLPVVGSFPSPSPDQRRKAKFYLDPVMGHNDSDSDSSESSLITGLNLNNSGQCSRYNPENTIPLGSRHLNASMRASFQSRSSTSIKIHPPDEDMVLFDNRSRTEISGSGKPKKQYKSYKQSIMSVNTRQNKFEKSNKTTRSFSTILAMGSSAIFSSESLLTTTTTSAMPAYHYNQTKFHDSIKSGSTGGLLQQNGTRPGDPLLGKPSISGDYDGLAERTLLSRHPLIDETRTRALSRAKLKQSSQVSALLSGFALVAMVEMDIQTPSTIPLSVLLFFIITTTLLVSVHVMALMISTCILPHVESMNAMQEIAITLGTAQYGDNQSNFGSQSSPSNRLSPAAAEPLITNQKNEFTNQTADRIFRAESTRIVEPSNYGTPPHQKMHWYISIAWFFSTVIGIFLFILELVAIVWVKFWDHNRNPDPEIENAKFMSDGTLIALISTILLIPVLLSLIYFAFHFYRKLVLLRYEMAQRVLDELNAMAEGLSVCDHGLGSTN